MSTRDELLGLLQRLVERCGPSLTFLEFQRACGVHPRRVYRFWGSWEALRGAAGLARRSKRAAVYTDDELLAELNRVGQLCEEFPSTRAFERLSDLSWSTIERRFGRRPAVWERYREWLETQGEEARPEFLRGVDLAGDPAAIPGVTSHTSAEARQKAIEDYDEMLTYLDPYLLGPPPPGWKPVKAKAKEGERKVPGGSTGAQSTAAEPPQRGAAVSPRRGGGLAEREPEALTPEEWNAFYNHPLAVPIVDIGAGLFPEMLRDRNPRDRRPNPPPWERGPGWPGDLEAETADG